MIVNLHLTLLVQLITKWDVSEIFFGKFINLYSPMTCEEPELDENTRNNTHFQKT